jgi:hypothetical protein
MNMTVPMLVFVAVSCLGFAAGMLLDQRRARARLIRQRLAAEQSQGKRSETLALVRDEMLSRIPAFDMLLRRSERVSKLQILLEPAYPMHSQLCTGSCIRLRHLRHTASE